MKFIPAYDLVPFDEAVRAAYEEGRASRSDLARFSERLSGRGAVPGSGSPEEILDHLAIYFAQSVPIFGKRPPSSKLEQLDALQAKYGVFYDGAKTFVPRGDEHSRFVDLRVSRKAMKQMKEEIKQPIFPR